MKAFIILSVCMIACILQFAEADEHNDECGKKKDEMRAIAEEMRKEGKMPECMKKHGMGESKKPWDEMSEEERAEKKEKWKNMSEEERDEITVTFMSKLKACMTKFYDEFMKPELKEKGLTEPSKECKELWRKQWMGKCKEE